MSSRAETRRRGLKKQQERKRQFAQVRRIDRTRKQKKEKATKKAAENKEKRVANLFQRIVGITAAQGFDRNLDPNLRLVSKAVSQNVLLTGVQEKRKRNDASDKLLLEYIRNLSYLASTWMHIGDNRNNDPDIEARMQARMREETQTQIDAVFEQIHGILQNKGTMYLPTLVELWRLENYYIDRILNENPIVK